MGFALSFIITVVAKILINYMLLLRETVKGDVFYFFYCEYLLKLK